MSHVRDVGTSAVAAGDQIVQHVADRDRLDLVVHPLRSGHHRQSVGQVADHLERRPSPTRHHTGLQHDGLDAEAIRISPTVVREDKMRRQFRAPRDAGPLR